MAETLAHFFTELFTDLNFGKELIVFMISKIFTFSHKSIHIIFFDLFSMIFLEL